MEKAAAGKWKIDNFVLFGKFFFFPCNSFLVYVKKRLWKIYLKFMKHKGHKYPDEMKNPLLRSAVTFIREFKFIVFHFSHFYVRDFMKSSREMINEI